MVDVDDGRAAVGDVATLIGEADGGGWATRWTSSLPGAARCSTSSWPGSVPGCRASTMKRAASSCWTGWASARAPTRPPTATWIDTLGNVARAVGGLRLPNSSGWGWESAGRSPACARGQSGRRVGVALPRSQGKDSTTGHWENLRGDTGAAVSHVPARLPTSLLDEFARRTGRGYLGNMAASGTQIIAELGAEHSALASGSSTRRPTRSPGGAHEERSPWTSLSGGGDRARPARGEPRRDRVIARPFAGKPGRTSARRTARISRSSR